MKKKGSKKAPRVEKTKSRNIILSSKFKKTRSSQYIYQIELDKAYFQHDTAHGDFKDLPRRTACDKMLRDKAFNIA